MPRPGRPIDQSWWWVHIAGVRRLTGSGAGGSTFTPAKPAPPSATAGLWKEETKLVRDPSGAEVVSSAEFNHPITDARIAPGSLLTSPAEFGGTEHVVISSAGYDTTDSILLPKFWQVMLK